MVDCIIVGSGICGSVAAREIAEHGKKVLIFERRNHVGGNVYDYKDENGFLVQKYGPHCFFTNKGEIKEYIERFIETVDCFVKCKTVIDGKRIPMPFNFRSIDMIYDQKTAERLKKKLTGEFPDREIVHVTELLNSADPDVLHYGRYMYENEYKRYSAKQWGRPIESISQDVFKRVPVYLSYRETYQSHKYQFLAKNGFTDLVHRILNHPNIEVKLNVDFLDGLEMNEKDGTIFRGGREITCPVLYTGEPDALFKFKHGTLPYRSLEFVWKTLNIKSYQDTEITAFPQADKITRVTEYTKLPYQVRDDKTVISIEIPFEYDRTAPFGNEPYYPIINDDNSASYMKYKDEAAIYPLLYLAGRLADYRYYNMDDAILRARETANLIVGTELHDGRT